MNIWTKRVPIILLSLLMVFVFAISTPGAYAKDISNDKGTAFTFSFSDFQMVGNVFPITAPAGDRSGNLWGAEDENGEIKAYDEDYKLSALEDVHFSAYNATSVYMFITFDVYACMNPSTYNNSSIHPKRFLCEINNVGMQDDINPPHLSVELLAEWKLHISNVYKYTALGFIPINYSQYHASVNPKDIDNANIGCFIIAPNEVGQFNMSIDDDGTGSCYASIKMQAHPCDQNGNLYKVENGEVVYSNGSPVYESTGTTSPN